MSYGILIVAYANGQSCPHAGRWVQTCKHDAFFGRGYVESTPDPEKALRFASSGEAMDFWRRQSKVCPRRPDGKPNRPLTAFTVLIEQLA